MKKKFISCLFGLFFAFCLFSETSTIIDEHNEYGGTTMKLLYDTNDKNFSHLVSSIYYFNDKDQTSMIIHQNNINQIIETGYKYQEVYFTNEVVTHYKLIFTEEVKNIRGYDSRIEYVTENDELIKYGYNWGKHLVKENLDAFTLKYEFYSLDYIYSIFFENYPSEITTVVYTLDERYLKIRSFVQFEDKLKDLNENDKKIILRNCTDLNALEMVDLYTKKITVLHMGKKYVSYIQNSLVPFIKKGNYCLLSFIPMGVNKDIYLFVTGFDDTQIKNF